jgi:hypothetical protein
MIIGSTRKTKMKPIEAGSSEVSGPKRKSTPSYPAPMALVTPSLSHCSTSRPKGTAKTMNPMPIWIASATPTVRQRIALRLSHQQISGSKEHGDS